MQNPITASVGERGVNRAQDVGIVQFLLNRANAKRGIPKTQIDVDGIVGPQTLSALKEFQTKFCKTVDGVVNPNSETLKMLHQIAGDIPRANDGVAFLKPEMGPTRIV
jgi:peptidoglycan hydrolase-like protein with peptidoglycan-binding domain